MMNKLLMKTLLSISALFSVNVMAEENAASLVEGRSTNNVSTAPELTDLLTRDDRLSPDIENYDVKIEQFQLQTRILEAMAERNGAIRQLEELYGLDDWLTGGSNAAAPQDGVRGNFNDSGSIDSFGNFGPVGRGAGDFMGNSEQQTNTVSRFAAMQSYLSFGGKKTAVVRWDPITPTVSPGDILPGGFSIIEIRKNDIVMEKDGILFSLTQEPVSIDALMEVIAQRRESEE